MLTRTMRKLARVICAASVAAALVAPTIVDNSAHAQETEKLWENVQKAGVLRCGAATAPPYVMRDPKSGEYSGFFVDLCREFGEKFLEVEVEFVDTTWDNIIAGLQAGKWDVSMALNRKPKRAMAMNFSIAASHYEISLLYNKENTKIPAGAQSISDIDKEDITLAVMSGTAQDHALTAVIKNARIMRLPGVDETRLAVMGRRADILVDAADTNWLFRETHPDWATTLEPSPALAKQGVAFGLRDSVSWSDMQVLNIYLEEKVAKGEVDGLIRKAVQEVLAEQGN